MNHKNISSKAEVDEFLNELKEILANPLFNVGTDLDILLKKKSELTTDPYTTKNTLLALDFDRNDVYNQLMSLETKEYMETIIDNKNSTLPPFYVFAKEIKNKDVYIKIKIRDRQKRKIFCVSFHFTRYPFPQTLPYQEV